MEDEKKLQKRFTKETIWVYVKAWLKITFWPIALLTVACYLGMPIEIGKALGAIVLIFTTSWALINFMCYIWNMDIPKIL